MRARHRLRALVNAANLSTPAGLVLAVVAAGSVRRGRAGLWIAHGYRPSVPPAPAFTVGNVVLLRTALPSSGADPVGSIPVRLLEHEERHATQYALSGGILMPAAYLVAAGWSWLRTGDWGAGNVFERFAGLADGGYRARPTRPLAQAGADLRRAVARLPRSRGAGAEPPAVVRPGPLAPPPPRSSGPPPRSSGPALRSPGA